MQGRYFLRRTARHQHGMGLIEVLIALLVLAIGMLGVAALQATALRNSQSALERSQAVIQTYSILDAMRANKASALAGDYDIVIDSPCSTPAAGVLAKQDLAAWRASIQTALGASACGGIVREGNAGNILVTIQWDDTRGTGGQTTQTLSTRTLL